MLLQVRNKLQASTSTSPSTGIIKACSAVASRQVQTVCHFDNESFGVYTIYNSSTVHFSMSTVKVTPYGIQGMFSTQPEMTSLKHVVHVYSQIIFDVLASLFYFVRMVFNPTKGIAKGEGTPQTCRIKAH